MLLASNDIVAKVCTLPSAL